jgi:hypothetical protein
MRERDPVKENQSTIIAGRFDSLELNLAYDRLLLVHGTNYFAQLDLPEF